MTTDEIRALIAKKISGQGSAIDVGNGLEPILNALCDLIDAGGGGGAAEPLVVIGTIDSSFFFTPNSGQPTFAQAKAAFENQGVILKFEETNNMVPFEVRVIGYTEGNSDMDYQEGIYGYAIESSTGSNIENAVFWIK